MAYPFYGFLPFWSFVTRRIHRLTCFGNPQLLIITHRIHRTVLLGDPGGGKTTFASKLCHDLATAYPNRIIAGRQVTPIHIVLRDYAAAKKERPCSFLEFVETTAASNYQLSSPPRGVFEYMLLNGRAVMVFDGLDELLDTSYRQTISADIESFCCVYPSVLVLVTSRRVGYDQAPLDPKEFNVFYLAPFDQKQVETYVGKWFNLDSGLSAIQKDQKVQAFMRESEGVSDLRANALLLGLMCNIYRGDGYIPKNRPDVYEKCATMLFERWDKRRGINYALPFEYHIKPAMMHLGYWVYSDEKRQSGVTEEELIMPAADYLQSRQFEERENAEYAARAFIEFCRGRAWVFTDIGTTATGNRLYQFTHRTFLEYFAAAYLVRTYRTPNDLVGFLLPKILEKEWDVVAQLAFQLQNKQLEGAGDELLELLLNQNTTDAHGMNALSFVTRCLEFMIPRPKVKKSIARAYADRLIAFGASHSESETTEGERKVLAEILTALGRSAKENKETVIGSFKTRIEEQLSSGQDLESYLAAEIGLYLTMILQQAGHHDWNEMIFWQDISNQFYTDNIEKLQPLIKRYFTLCYDAFWGGRVFVSDVADWYGGNSLFRPAKMVLHGMIYAPLAHYLLDVALRKTTNDVALKLNHPHFVHRVRNLRDAGRILLQSVPPWINQENSKYLRAEECFQGTSEPPADIDDLVKFGADGLFGLFAIMVAFLEVLEKRGKVNSVLSTIEHRLYDIPWFKWMSKVFLARYQEIAKGEIESALSNCAFTDSQSAFVWAWINREIDLVQESRTDKEHD